MYMYTYMNQSGVKHIKTAPISGDNAFNKMASLHASIGPYRNGDKTANNDTDTA